MLHRSITLKERTLRHPRQTLDQLIRRRTGPPTHAPAGWHDPLSDLPAFGPNPGALRMRAFIPPGLAPGAGLLVALHGCTQTASGFDHGCGWSELAAAHGFALLLPEQRRDNNPGHCFNWFEPGDTARGQGEVESIRAAVAHMVAAHRLDPARVFVTGLSAGGAMAATLLATHPDVFAAGAVIAGLPHGAASSVQEAFEAMAGSRSRGAATWAARARAAAPPGTATWPRLAVWHGTADHTVSPRNAEALVQQWAGLHGLDPARPAAEEPLGRAGAGQRREWRDAAGRVVLEANIIAGLDHGVPINPGQGEGHGGRTMPYILDAGIAAPGAIVAFFGLAEAVPFRAQGVIAIGADGVARTVAPAPHSDLGDEPARSRSQPSAGAAGASSRPGAGAAGAWSSPGAGAAGTWGNPGANAPGTWSNPGDTIRQALRAAGLLR